MPIGLARKADFFLQLIGSPVREKTGNCKGQEEFQFKLYVVLLFE